MLHRSKSDTFQFDARSSAAGSEGANAVVQTARQPWSERWSAGRADTLCAAANKDRLSKHFGWFADQSV